MATQRTGLEASESRRGRTLRAMRPLPLLCATSHLGSSEAGKSHRLLLDSRTHFVSESVRQISLAGSFTSVFDIQPIRFALGFQALFAPDLWRAALVGAMPCELFSDSRSDNFNRDNLGGAFCVRHSDYKDNKSHEDCQAPQNRPILGRLWAVPV